MVEFGKKQLNSLLPGNEASLEMVMRLGQWLESEEIASYDWWDLWATRFGSWAKCTYDKNPLLGSVGVVPLTLLDLIYPGFRRFTSEKRSFPISHCHVGLGYLNLFRATKGIGYLRKAEKLVEPLRNMASSQIKGLGWGMNLDWMTVDGLIPRDTPCNSQTAYAYEFFAALAEATKEPKYTTYLEKIASHVANDFLEWRDGDRLACSYSTKDKRKVVNANSYRMLMLLDAARRFQNDQYQEKGLATLRYVLSMQQPDGSWPYSEEERFVDCYHTCFVLKNLYKSKGLADGLKEKVEGAIERGLRFYFAHLFYANGYPRPFAVKPRLVLHRYDSYDLAESIGLLSLLQIEEDRLSLLIDFARNEFQTKEGWFAFRKYAFVPLKGIPYMRYANSAMFLALTHVVRMKAEGISRANN